MLKINSIIHIYAEPADYTIDLINNIDKKLKIEYAFLNNHSKYNFENIKEKKINFSSLKNIILTKHIIIINGYLNWVFFSLFILRLLNIIKVKIGIESDTFFRERPSFTNKIKRFIFSRKFIFGLAGGYHGHKQYFIKNGMKKQNIFVFPMMVDSKKFKCNIKPITDKIKFYFLGKFYERKNVGFLIESFLMASKKNNNIELNLIGDGPDFSKLKSLYEKFDHIKFYGPIKNKDLQDIIKDFHYIILPSKYEPWGLVINESFACGKLALVSNEIGCIDDFKDIIHDWMIFNPYSKDSLVKAILDAAKYKDYDKYANKASHFINFKWNYKHYETNLFKFLDYVDKKNNKT